MLRAIGQRFHTYTATDISAAFSENIDAVSFEYGKRVSFKVLDVEKDPLQQGYAEGAYDLVIAFSVLHATSNLERTLRHTRKLLKPGGHLLVGEANNSIQPGSLPGVIFGTLPGWWLGHDDGRVLSPLISPEQWDRLLRSTGFSGIDVTAPDELQDFFGATLFLSQAVDDVVNFLRSPLSTPCIFSPIDTLAIVGGQTERSAPITDNLKVILKDFASEVHTFETVEDVKFDKIGTCSPIISLTELDKPIFKDLTPTRFSALKNTFGAARDLLWLTSGRRWQEPFSNMTVGFGRTARNETPELRLQFLDVEDLDLLDARKISEIFLRLRTQAEQRGNTLWPLEPEIVIDSQQRELVPRLRHMSTLNDRYNSTRRVVTREVNIKTSPVIMEPSQNGCVFKELRVGTLDDKERLIELRTTHTILSAINTPLGHKFLILGIDPSSGSSYLALVPSPASVLRVSPAYALRCSTTHSSMPLMLTLTAAHLVATTILYHLFAGQTLVVHNPTQVIAHAISAHAHTKDVSVVFTADSGNSEKPSDWVKIPPHSNRSALSGMLPANTACFVGFWSQDALKSPSESALVSSLPRSCRIEAADTIYSFHGSDQASSAPVLARILARASEYAEMHENYEQHATLSRSITLGNLVDGTIPSNPMTVVDWISSGLLPVRVTSLDSGSLLQSDKTYWLAGLTGALGVSLSDWMIEHGARSLVLTSRSPQVHADWISSHERKGVTITIMSW